MFNNLRRKALKVMAKSLYDIFPELRDRIHYNFGDSPGTLSSQQPAQSHQASAWVYKAVEVWARLIAPLRLMVVDHEGKVVRQHALDRLLMAVNPDSPNSSVWSKWARNMALYGEAPFEVKYDGLRLSHLLPIDPRYLEPVPDESARQYYRINHFKIIRAPYYAYSLSTSHLIFWRFDNPYQPYRGLAPLTAVRHTVTNDQLAVAWQYHFFKNFAMPGVALFSKQGLTSGERQAMEKTFAERFGLTTNDWGMYKPIVLEEGIHDLKVFSTPPKDIAWLDQRGVNQDEIAGVFGIMPEMMGFRTGKYNNYDVSEQIVWTLTMLPLIQFRDDWLTHFLITTGQLLPTQRVQTDLSKVYALRRVLDPVFRQGNYFYTWGAPFAKINKYFDLGFPHFEGDEISNPFGSNVSVGPQGIIDPNVDEPVAETAVPNSDESKHFGHDFFQRKNGTSKIYSRNGRSFSFAAE